jgi:hypothetical protein
VILHSSRVSLHASKGVVKFNKVEEYIPHVIWPTSNINKKNRGKKYKTESKKL